MRKRDRITSLDIAHRAGVSQATVSRVLSGSPLVSEETRRRVQAIARELNYKVDRHASSLRTQRAGTLALLLFEDPTGDDSHINPFFLSMLGSLTRACARRDHDLLVSFQQLSDDWHADYEDSMKADGLILLGYGDYTAHRSTLESLVAQGTHFVRWGAVLPDQPGVSVGCDNRQGGRLAGEHLLALGRRRIAFLGHADERFPEFAERYGGCADALAAQGLAMERELQVDAETCEDEGARAATQLLARGQPFDAVFAASDAIAIGAMHVLMQAGLRIPQDVAVAGFDDIPMARYCVPPLTTVQQDTSLAGEVLVETLLGLIAEQPVSGRVLPTRLVMRASSGGAGAATA